MIPDFNHSHVLPPFLGDSPTAASDVSPYRASMLELTQRFASLPGRRRLIEGLLDYRADLAALGFVRGFQWLDGSFAEDVEAHEQRPPNDIDIVTHFERQASGFSPRSERSSRNGLPLKNASAILRCQDLIRITCKNAVSAL